MRKRDKKIKSFFASIIEMLAEINFVRWATRSPGRHPSTVQPSISVLFCSSSMKREKNIERREKERNGGKRDQKTEKHRERQKKTEKR